MRIQPTEHEDMQHHATTSNELNHHEVNYANSEEIDQLNVLNPGIDTLGQTCDLGNLRFQGTVCTLVIQSLSSNIERPPGPL